MDKRAALTQALRSGLINTEYYNAQMAILLKEAHRPAGNVAFYDGGKPNTKGYSASHHKRGK